MFELGGPGHDWKRGRRLGEADRPGPLMPFWSPLLDGNLKEASRRRYEVEVRHFVEFVRDRGDRIDTREDLDYWMAYYCHVAYTEGSPSKGAVEKTLAGVEHWLPEFKPLPLTRRCVRGWGKAAATAASGSFPSGLSVGVRRARLSVRRGGGRRGYDGRIRLLVAHQ